jgi:hypothetical protein
MGGVGFGPNAPRAQVMPSRWIQIKLFIKCLRV